MSGIPPRLHKRWTLDRRVVYLFILIALGVPLALRYSVRPARMESAEKLYQVIEDLQVAKGEIVLVGFDFGPNSKAENEPQAEVVIEHLMRRRIPFATISQYILAQPYLDGIPEKVAQRLMREFPQERWVYGQDWVNLGLRLNASVTIQAIGQSENIAEYLKKDARGTRLTDIPLFREVKTLQQIKALVQFTSLTGTFETYVQFLKSANYRPLFLHGCTSITIPKAYIYLDSGQLNGLLEGVAGAAWYSTLLSERFPKREKDASVIINTGLGVAHLVIVALILLGNIEGIRTLLSARRKLPQGGTL